MIEFEEFQRLQQEEEDAKAAFRKELQGKKGENRKKKTRKRHSERSLRGRRVR
jgi:hypothetical protein